MFPRDIRWSGSAPHAYQARTRGARQLFDADSHAFAVLTSAPLASSSRASNTCRAAHTLDPTNKVAAKVCHQIEKYLADPEYQFQFPVRISRLRSSSVWRAIHAIPCGSTLTYMDVARQLKSAPRPVSGACGANRLPLVIPATGSSRAAASAALCILAAASDTDAKQWLLKHENAG
jgi:methylated-DNA-[protein]-cysteine S-methyltransferase